MNKILIAIVTVLLVSCSSESDSETSNFNQNYNQAYYSRNGLGETELILVSEGLNLFFAYDDAVGELEGNGDIIRFMIELQGEDWQVGEYPFENTSENFECHGGVYSTNYTGDIGLSDNYGVLEEDENAIFEVISYTGNQIELYFSISIYEFNDYEVVGTVEGVYNGPIEELEILW